MARNGIRFPKINLDFILIPEEVRPDLGGVLRKNGLRIGVHDHPVPSHKLGIQLLRSPARVAGINPDPLIGVPAPERIRQDLQAARHIDMIEDFPRPFRRRVGPEERQHPIRADRAAEIDRPRQLFNPFHMRKGPGERNVGGTVDDQAECALFSVRQQ